MQRTIQFFLIVFCAVVFSLTANAQAPAAGAIPQADPRVAKALKEAGTEFQISSSDGDYEVIYGTKNNRRQRAFIVSETGEINGVEMRLVFSFAMIADKLPSQQTAALLLEENMKMSGGWALLKVDKQYAIVNRIWVPADLSGNKLDATLQELVVVADAMEDRLTKKDVH